MDPQNCRAERPHWPMAYGHSFSGTTGPQAIVQNMPETRQFRQIFLYLFRAKWSMPLVNSQ